MGDLENLRHGSADAPAVPGIAGLAPNERTVLALSIEDRK
jgi:hypothetical protein